MKGTILIRERSSTQDWIDYSWRGRKRRQSEPERPLDNNWATEQLILAIVACWMSELLQVPREKYAEPYGYVTPSCLTCNCDRLKSVAGIFTKLETLRVVVLTVDYGFALYDWELRVPRVLDRDRMCECEDDGCLWWDTVLCSPARRTLSPRAPPSSSGSSHWSSAAGAPSTRTLPVIS